MITGMKHQIRCGGRPVTIIVLAGGRGRRMKSDKARLPVRGGTLLEHVLGQVRPYFEEVLVSVSAGQRFSIGRTIGARTRPGEKVKADRQAPRRSADGANEQGTRCVVDRAPNLGPMAGLLAGLKAATNDICAIVACDIPDVHVPLLRKLARAAEGAEIAVPVDQNGDFEPLFAVYSKAVVPKIEELLRAGERSLIPLLRDCRTARVPLEDASWLRNLNTRRDYDNYIKSFPLRQQALGPGHRNPRWPRRKH